jgi:hypothetical protein
VLSHTTLLDRVPPYHLRYNPHMQKPWVRFLFDKLMDI